jgi:hypothetical protein
VVATKKVTITLPVDVVDRVTVLAGEAGLPVSTYITRIAEHHIRIQDGLAAMREWEAEHGPLTDEELTQADERIAGALTHQRDEMRHAG